MFKPNLYCVTITGSALKFRVKLLWILVASPLQNPVLPAVVTTDAADESPHQKPRHQLSIELA